MQKLAVVGIVFVATLLVGATRDVHQQTVSVGVADAEAGGKCLPDNAKCGGSQLQCCSKPCTNGVCRN